MHQRLGTPARVPEPPLTLRELRPRQRTPAHKHRYAPGISVIRIMKPLALTKNHSAPVQNGITYTLLKRSLSTQLAEALINDIAVTTLSTSIPSACMVKASVLMIPKPGKDHTTD